MTDTKAPGTPFHLCLMLESGADADQLVNALQDASSRLQVQHIKSMTGLRNAIDKDRCDVIAGVPQAKRVDPYKALALLDELEKAIPVIGIGKPDNDVDVVEAMNNGLADLVALDNPEHLVLVIQREIRNRAALAGAAEGPRRDFTGLYSRLHFLDRLQKTIKEPDLDGSMALMYLQLDSFGWINENIGIAAGDLFLKAIAERIQETIGELDFPARYHGGTFVILTHGDGINGLHTKARHLANSIANLVFDYRDQSVSSTCSIGLSLLTEVAENTQKLITNAFIACENAKASGGNDVHWFGTQSSSGDDEGDPEAWVTRIRRAFENDMFTLLFQPIISLKGHEKPRYEVLLRMLSEEGDTIMPGDFLPYAERAGLMADIDRWVITHSLEAARDLRGSGIEPEIYLKMSGQTLADKTMPAWVSHAFAESNCPASCIVFEITESLATTHIAQSRMLIGWLKQLGCKIGLDHFGTTPNSLSLLDQMEVDYVKIDGSLIRGLQYDEEHKLQVKRIIDKARGMSVGTIAESVQDAGSLPIIWQYGVEFIQGYFLQEPEAEMHYDFTQLAF